MPREDLGPAERIIQTLLTYTDHMYHGRPGIVRPAPGTPIGVTWSAVSHRMVNGEKVIFLAEKVGKKQQAKRLGVCGADNIVRENGAVVGEFRRPGLFPEVAAWTYRQIAEVWKLDNEFAARWASFAWRQEHRDLKVALAAFMLVQSRKGDPQRDGDKIAFLDADYRDIGEAMLLLHRREDKDGPKRLGRVGDLLKLPAVAAINRELGFGVSPVEPFLGRWPKAVRRWLAHREENPKLLEGLVKAGYRTTVMELAQVVGYKPETPRFFAVLRWKQAQAGDGRRKVAIGAEVKAADSWEDLTEVQVCERIVAERPSYKRLIGLLPPKSITRAVMAAAIEAGALSDKDLIIASPTLEELGLLEVQSVKDRWMKALRTAEDLRALQIARNVKTQETKEKLQEAGDTALKKAAEEVVKGVEFYVIVDISGSMEGAIDAAKGHIARFVQGIPLAQLHVSVFNTAGREVRIEHASALGVQNAFKGITAGGATDYGSGVMALAKYKPAPGHDAFFLFVGDEGNNRHFTETVQMSGLNPVAFGIIPCTSPRYGRSTMVRDTAVRLGIPCFEIDEKTFADPYAIPRTLRAMIAAAPVGRPVAAAPARQTLVDTILSTDLLKKPAWALPAPAPKGEARA